MMQSISEASASAQAIVAAAPPSGGGVLNMSGLEAVMVSLVGLLLIVVGMVILGRSRKGNLSETAAISAGAIVGVIFVAMGAGSFAVVAFGSKILDTVFS